MIPNNFPYKHSGNVEIFDFYESADVLVGATDALIERRVSAQVQKCWITQLGLGIDNPAAFNGTIWQIRINGVPNFYYADIRDELGPFDDPRDIAPIPVEPGSIIDVFVFNNTAGPHLYAARLRGFYDYGSKG